MSTQLTTAVTNRLVSRLLAGELTSAEVREITKWDAPKMSIRLALASLAKARGLVMKAKVEVMENGRKMLCAKFAEPKKAAVAKRKSAVAVKIAAAPVKKAAAMKPAKQAAQKAA